MNYKIAILYICTGRYKEFFADFYKSSEKYYLPAHQKEYYVFTDDEQLCCFENVHIIPQKCQGFPYDSLFHFEYFLKIKEWLVHADYIIYLNSNALFLDYVTDEILPHEEDGNLVAAEWPWVYLDPKPIYDYPYERNRSSLAYIEPYKPPYHYFMGGINGGRTVEYLNMCETLASNIRDDFNRGIVAKFHDESHVNKFFRSHKCKILPVEYCIPEEWVTNDIKPKMIFRAKERISREYVKQPEISFDNKYQICQMAKRARRKIGYWSHVLKWYLKI